ncbi:hypothetical protein SLEP1_g43138 [Rubroshorea leprosula]|uniref:Uncharacterized protein n=1 Tax=Rubroshorea leprosula TaxID=152421 RepID=A0AAV5LDK4_9ROSI|nr:hypothetical protein SLEP1_g43138 [Rubroshorea leprosula]
MRSRLQFPTPAVSQAIELVPLVYPWTGFSSVHICQASSVKFPAIICTSSLPFSLAGSLLYHLTELALQLN